MPKMYLTAVRSKGQSATGYRIKVGPQFFYAFKGSGADLRIPIFTPLQSMARVFVSQYLCECFAEFLSHNYPDVSVEQVRP